VTRRFVWAICPVCNRRLRGWIRRFSRGSAPSPVLPNHKVPGFGWCNGSGDSVESLVVAGVRNTGMGSDQ
jgi:hypothetical protein